MKDSRGYKIGDNVISAKDLKAIEAYNAEIDNCVTSQTAWNRTMTKSSKAAQDLVEGANGGKVALNGLQKTSKLAAVGMTAFNTALNAGIILLVTLAVEGLIKVLDNYIHKTDKAIEKIQEAREEYEENKTSLDSLNSELDSTNEKINELLNKDSLTLTEDAELKKLQRENQELERQIELQKERLQTSQKIALVEIRTNNSEIQNKIDSQLEKYNASKTDYDNVKNGNQKVMGGDAVIDPTNPKGQELYEKNLAEEEGKLETAKAELLKTVEEIEKERLTILEAYDYNLESMTDVDKKLYNQLNTQLLSIYEELYGKNSAEYQQFVISPIFSTEGVETSEQELLDYFANGGDKTEKALEQNFGTAAVEAMKRACELAGITFDEFILTLYNNVNPTQIKHNSPGMTTAEANEVIDNVNQLSNESQKLDDWGLSSYKEDALSGKLQSKYGNIDMNNREVIKYNDEILEANKEAMSTWEQETDEAGNVVWSYYDSIKEAVENGEEAVDTVFGGSNSFELNGNEIEVAYSPIMQTDEGAKFVAQDELYNYIQDIINEAKNRVGENASEEDIFAEALRLDSEEGKTVGEEYGKGLIAGITNYVSGVQTGNIDAGTVGGLMHFSGSKGAIGLAQSKSTTDKILNHIGTNTSSNVNNQIDAQYNQQQGINNQKKLNAFLGLDKDEQKLVLTTEIPDDVKKGTEADFKTWLNQLREEAKIEVDVDNKVAVSSLNDISSAMSTISNAYTDFKDKTKDTIDASNLQAIGDIFNVEDWAGGTEAYEDFLSVVTSGTSTVEEQQDAFNKLATAYIDHTDLIKNLCMENADYTKSELEKLGVTNSEEVVWSRLGNSIENTQDVMEYIGSTIDNTDAYLEDYDGTINDAINDSNFLKNATYDDVNALLEEANASDEAKNTLMELALREASADGGLDFTKNIKKIKAYIKALGYASASVNILNDIDNGLYSVSSSDYAKIVSEAEKSVNDILAKIDEGVDYKPPGSTTTKSNNSNDKDNKYKAEAKVYDWIAKRIEYVTDKAEKLSKKVERFTDRVDTLKESISNLLYLGFDTKDVTQQITSAANSSMKQMESAIAARQKVIETDTKASKKYLKQAKKQATQAVKDQVTSDLTNLSDEEKAKYKKKYGVNAKGKMTPEQKTKVQSYITKMQKGTLGKNAIESIKDPVVKAYLDSYQEWYDKSKSAQDSAQSARDEINSLMDSYKTMAENIANAPIDVATEKLNQLSEELDLINAKADNIHIDVTVTANGQSVTSGKIAQATTDAYKQLKDDTIANNNAQLKANETASNTADARYNKTSKALTTATSAAQKSLKNHSTKKSSGLNKNQRDKLSKILAAGTEEVPQSLLNNISNQALLTKCLEYNEALLNNNAAFSAKKSANNTYNKSLEEIEQANVTAEKTYFDNIQDAYDKQIQLVQAREDSLNRAMDLFSSRNDVLKSDDYQKQIAIEKEKLKYYNEQKTALEAQLAAITPGTTEWYEAKDALEGVNANIDGVSATLSEIQVKINDIGDTIATKIKDAISSAKSELDTVISTLDYASNFDSLTHLVTSEGITRLGSYATNLSVAQEQQKSASTNKNTLAKLLEGDAEYDKDTKQYVYKFKDTNGSDFALTYSEAKKKLADYSAEEQQAIADEYAAKKNIWEWEKEKLEAEKAIAQDLVDATKETLNTAKDLHDYQKSIKEKTDNISTLQTQIAALSGNGSEDATARMQSLQKQLMDAQEDLQETEYDRYISDLQSIYDKMMAEYSDLITAETQDFENLVKIGLQDANSNLKEINSTISNQLKTYSYEPLYDLMGFFDGTHSTDGTINGNVIDILGEMNKELKDQAELQNFYKVIDDIGTVEYTDDSKAKIEAARKAYDELDDSAKAKVSSGYLSKLTTAEGRYETLKSNNDDQELVKTTLESIKTVFTNGDINGASALLTNLSKTYQSYKTSHGDDFDTDESIKKSIESLATQISQAISAQNAAAEQQKLRDEINDRLKKVGYTEGGTKLKSDLSSLANKDIRKTDEEMDVASLRGAKIALKALGYGSGINVTNDKWGEDFTKKVAEYKSTVMGMKNPDGTHVGKDMYKSLIDQLTSAGFSSGGIVEAVHRNGDDGLATLKHGEAVFTPAQTKTFTQEFMPAMDSMIDSANWLKEMATNAQNATVNNTNSTNNVEANYSFNLENVTNAQDMIKQIQSSTQLQDLLYDATVGKSLSSNKNRTKLNKY